MVRRPDDFFDTAYLLLYVDDIILTTCTAGLLSQLMARLHAEFAIKDLGPLHYFLGVRWCAVRMTSSFISGSMLMSS